MIARLVVLFTLLSAAPAAAAEVVSSSFAQLTGADGCLAERIEGCGPARALGYAESLAVSPDQRHVYGVSSGTSRSGANALNVFTRDPTTGALTHSACVSDDGGDGTVGSDGVCADGDALTGAAGVAVSPDGASVYVASRTSSGIAVFSRDAETGAVTQTSCVTAWGEGRCDGVGSLKGAQAVAVSPDNLHVYVVSGDGDSLVSFARDAETGALTVTGCATDTGSDGACVNARALVGASEVAVTPDGRQVVVTSALQGTVELFDRDAETGAVTPGACFVEEVPAGGGCTRLVGIGGASSAALSPDGRSLYVTGRDSLVAFTRDPEAGTLTPAGCFVNEYPSGEDSVYQEPDEEEYVDEEEDEEFAEEEDEEDYDYRQATTCTGARALYGANDVVVSPDGRSVFTAGGGNVGAFDRNRETGELRQTGCAESYLTYKSCSAAVGLGSWLRGLATTEDGRNLYVVGGGSVGVFGATVAVTTRRARVSAGIARVRLACPPARRRGCTGRVHAPGHVGRHFSIRRGHSRTVRLRVGTRRRVTVRATDARRITRAVKRRLRLR